MAEDDGYVITFFVFYLCKLLIIKHLDARGVEPLFPTPTSSMIQDRFSPRGFRDSKP